MDVRDIANRALTRPGIYVPALVDEIVRLRQELDHLRNAILTAQDLTELKSQANTQP